MFILPKAWEASPTTVVPIKDAPFPQISIRPKYSPERSGGTILQNKTGTVPECPPLEHSHKDCQHPELPLCLHKHGKMVIPIYAAIQIKISFPVSYFSASLPNRMENGNATNCVTSNARSSPVESKPPHRNHGKCNHHSCFKRKSHFLIPKHKNKTYNERNTASCISPGISDLVDRIRS